MLTLFSAPGYKGASNSDINMGASIEISASMNMAIKQVFERAPSHISAPAVGLFFHSPQNKWVERKAQFAGMINSELQ